MQSNGNRYMNFEGIEQALVDLRGFHSLRIAYIHEGGRPEINCNLLKRLVGERGFEPPTPWLLPTAK
jgi:hypothetical protein